MPSVSQHDVADLRGAAAAGVDGACSAATLDVGAPSVGAADLGCRALLGARLRRISSKSARVLPAMPTGLRMTVRISDRPLNSA